MRYLYPLLPAVFVLTACAHRDILVPPVLDGPSEFIFRDYPVGTTYRTDAHDDVFTRYTEVTDGSMTHTKNEVVRYQMGVQVVRLPQGCFKTTSRRVGFRIVRTVMTVTKPPTPLENTEPVLKIETVPVDCAAYFGG